GGRDQQRPDERARIAQRELDIAERRAIDQERQQAQRRERQPQQRPDQRAQPARGHVLALLAPQLPRQRQRDHHAGLLSQRRARAGQPGQPPAPAASGVKGADDAHQQQRLGVGQQEREPKRAAEQKQRRPPRHALVVVQQHQ